MKWFSSRFIPLRQNKKSRLESEPTPPVFVGLLILFVTDGGVAVVMELLDRLSLFQPDCRKKPVVDAPQGFKQRIAADIQTGQQIVITAQMFQGGILAEIQTGQLILGT